MLASWAGLLSSSFSSTSSFVSCSSLSSSSLLQLSLESRFSLQEGIAISNDLRRARQQCLCFSAPWLWARAHLGCGGMLATELHLPIAIPGLCDVHLAYHLPPGLCACSLSKFWSACGAAFAEHAAEQAQQRLYGLRVAEMLCEDVGRVIGTQHLPQLKGLVAHLLLQPEALRVDVTQFSEASPAADANRGC